MPADELEKARNFAKGRFVLQLESPQGTIMFGLRREVLEGRAIEPQEVLDGLDAVTADDVQRVAQQLIADDALRLALIGPFDDDPSASKRCSRRSSSRTAARRVRGAAPAGVDVEVREALRHELGRLGDQPLELGDLAALVAVEQRQQPVGEVRRRDSRAARGTRARA